MKYTVAVASLAALVSAHGNITSPAARLAGPAMAAACGQAAVDAVNADGTIPLENITPETAACRFQRASKTRKNYEEILWSRRVLTLSI